MHHTNIIKSWLFLCFCCIFVLYLEKRPQLVFCPTGKGQWIVQPFDVYEICWDGETSSFIDDAGNAVAL